MKLQSAISNRKSKIGFTLIELLAVITIIIIVVAVALPGLKAIQATAMQTAVRQITNEMKLSRQYAITRRTTVRFAICTGTNDVPARGTNHVARAYIILAATNDVDNNLVGWIPVQDWKFLPDGIVFSDVNSNYYDPLWATYNTAAIVAFRTNAAATANNTAWQYFDSSAVTTGYFYSAGTWTNNIWNTSVVDFRSTGNVSIPGGNPAAGIRIIQGTVLNPCTNASPPTCQIMVNSTNNWAYIEYSQLGGRVRSRYVDSYNQ
jgi:Tfp pilus assembly protein FimT